MPPTADNLADMKAKLNCFLPTIRLPGPLLFAKVGGSRSHNCETPSSDWDYAGVYCCDPMETAGLSPQDDVVKQDRNDGAIREKDEPDFQFFEARKYCVMLSRGTAIAVEFLFTDHAIVSTPAWDALRSVRDEFLTGQTVDGYLGSETVETKSGEIYA